MKKLTPEEVDATADSLYEIGTELRKAGKLEQAYSLAIAGMRMVRNDIDHRRTLHDAKKEQDRLEEVSITDSLTGLPNRSGYIAIIKHELAEVNRLSKMGVAVAMVDLDGFKDINDKFGHEKGDEILKKVAQRLQEVFRTTDVVCRLGGDELIIVLPFEKNDHFDKGQIEDLIRDALTNLYVWHDLENQPYPIGASIGIAASNESEVEGYSELDSKMEKLTHIADKRMYQNKWRNGVYSDTDKKALYHPKNERLEHLRVAARADHELKMIEANGPDLGGGPS